MYAGRIQAGDPGERAIDYVKAQARIVLVETHFVILPGTVVSKTHRTEFDIKDPIGRTA